jgi:undecaprenyl-diphosphatase
MKALCESLIFWDETFLNNIFRLKQYRLIARYVPVISRTGDGYLYPVMGLAFWLVDHRLGAMLFLSALAAFAVELPLYKLIKHIVRRSRPCDALCSIEGRVRIADRFSFPSGHTSGAFVMATVVSAFYPMISALFFAWAGLVGFSRIYLGVHYPSDVLAGIVVGICCGATGISIVM